MGRRGKPQQNLVGQRFNHLTVLEMIPGSLTRTPSVRCQCDCGNIVIATTSNVKRGNTKSCGCIKHGHGGPRKKVERLVERTPDQCRRLSPKADLTGQRFGMVTVTGFAGRDRNGKPVFDCVCDCGKTCQIRGSSLIEGDTKSCGCYRAIKSREIHVTHGDCGKLSQYNHLYLIWKHMLNRCYSPDGDGYNLYGGRGVTVCDEWHDWGHFKEWAIRSGWKEGLSIDRIDVNGNYFPDNCRWTDMRGQSNNKRNNLLLSYMGATKTVAEWSRVTGIPYQRVWKGFHEGKSPEEIFKDIPDDVMFELIGRSGDSYNGRASRPGRNSSVFVEHDGVTMSLSGWSKCLGVSYKKVYDEYRRGRIDDFLTTTLKEINSVPSGAITEFLSSSDNCGYVRKIITTSPNTERTHL